MNNAARSFVDNNFVFAAVFRIQIRTNPHKEMPPGNVSGFAWTDPDPHGQIQTDPHTEMPPGYGSGFAWTDAVPDPDPGGKKA